MLHILYIYTPPVDYKYKLLLNKYKYIFNLFNKPLNYKFKLKANERFIIFFIFVLMTILFLKFITLEAETELVYNILFFISIILLICFIVIMFYLDFKHKDLTEALLKNKKKYKFYTDRYMIGFTKKQKDFNEIQNLKQVIDEMEHLISKPNPYDSFSLLALVLLGFGFILGVVFALYTVHVLNIHIFCITYIIQKIFCILVIIFGLFILRNLIKKVVNFFCFLFPIQFLDFINCEFNAVKIRSYLLSLNFFIYQTISLALYGLCFFIFFTIFYIYNLEINFYVAIFSGLLTNIIKIFFIKKNYNFVTFLCIFIYLVIVITVSKFLFLVLCAPSFSLSIMRNVLDKIHNDSGQDVRYQSCMVGKEDQTFSVKTLDKIVYYLDNQIKSFLFLFSKDYRAPVLPNWVWDYAKAPALKYVEANCIVEQKHFFTNSNGRVDHITDRFKITSKGDMTFLGRKRVCIRTLTDIQERFYMKEPIKECKNFNFLHKTRPCQIKDDYTSIYPSKKDIYTLSLNKQAAYNTITKNYIKLNKINIIDEYCRYEALARYRGLWKINAIFRTTTYSVDFVVNDLLFMSNHLLKEVYPRLCLVWTQPYSINRLFITIVEEYLHTYDNYKQKLSYLYSYHKDIFIKMPSLDLPRYYCYHNILNNERMDNFRQHLNHIHGQGFFLHTIPYMSAEVYPLPLVTENFANLGKIWFVTSEGEYIRRDIRTTPTIIEDDINWLHISLNKDKLSKALGFYHNENYINVSQKKLMPFYTPNNYMRVSYDRIIYLIEKVKIISKINTPILYRF